MKPLTPMSVEVEITALASGGDGVARDGGGRVVFVPLTAPGDRVRAKLVEAKPSFARGEVVLAFVKA
jgi:23S rRNA (uracil1939-C5)-methyltransferase